MTNLLGQAVGSALPFISDPDGVGASASRTTRSAQRLARAGEPTSGWMLGLRHENANHADSSQIRDIGSPEGSSACEFFAGPR